MKKINVILITTAAFVLFGYSCKKASTVINKGLGLIENTDVEIETVNEADIDEDVLTRPAAFSLDGPPILSQGNTSKCVAFSGAYYIVSMYNGVKSSAQNFDKAGSPEFAYAYTKQVNNDAQCSKGLYLFNGTNITGAAEVLKTVGTTSYNQVPFVNENTCALVDNTLITQAGANKVGDYYRLDKDQYNNLDELKSWIYAGYPLWFSAKVDEGFQNLQAGEIWNKDAGVSKGGHAMVLVGFDDNKKPFKIANSWGTDWADNGYAWVDYEYFKALINARKQIGVLKPSASQKAVFNTLSPASCGNANWGNVYIANNRPDEIAIEMTGTNYTNTDASNIDASEKQYFTYVPSGAIQVKVYNKDKSTLISTQNISVTQCDDVVVTIN